LARTETIALLCAWVPALSEELADKLAAELGDLPLAAAQAAGYLEQTDLPPADYLRRFRAHRASLLSRGEVLGYSGRLDPSGIGGKNLLGQIASLGSDLEHRILVHSAHVVLKFGVAAWQQLLGYAEK
jgi:hypothetical protein